jgi:hypothetical protein
MAKQHFPLHLECDAPAYCIVKASRCGLRAPEDVRWMRLKHLVIPGHTELRCRCGQAFPILVKWNFTMASGAEQSYWLGQCANCLTVYWETV